MRMSQEEKERSHSRIVEGAARLLRERGIESTSVADVMAQAGMTIGGFYKHFDSKDALVERALADAFGAFVDALGPAEGAGPVADFRSRYLSRRHRDDPGMGCPVAAVGTEVARGSARVKAAFGAGVRGVVGLLTGAKRGGAARTAALREFSMLVGAMVIARASDPQLADEVLAACGGEAGPREG